MVEKCLGTCAKFAESFRGSLVFTFDQLNCQVFADPMASGGQWHGKIERGQLPDSDRGLVPEKCSHPH